MGMGVPACWSHNSRMRHEMAGDDRVEHDEDDEREREEHGDAHDEEESGPEGVSLCQTHRHDTSIQVHLVVVVCHPQDGTETQQLL